MKLHPVGRFLKALVDPSIPILAQLVVTRRCNLSCGYCNEYDQYSSPVDANLLKRSVDHLAELGTCVITLTGGEPLLNPHLEDIITHAVSRHMVCTSVTNAYLLTPERIAKLNRSGLSLLQVSIDNLNPDETSRKSLNRLRGKLRLLKDEARFRVNLNAVLGSVPPEETRTLAEEIRALGFYMTVSVLHNGGGTVDQSLLGEIDLEELFAHIQTRRRRSLSHRFGEGWESEMLRAGQSDWKCRAGSRFLYIDEFGIVSFCSQRRGEPGIPLLQYGHDEIRQFFPERKGCEPGCTLGCVRRASAFDRLRHQGTQAPLAVPESVAVSVHESRRV